MSTTQELPRPPHSDVDTSWRKRPARLAATMAHQVAKRLKHSSTATSSDHNQDKVQPPPFAVAQSLIPSNSTSRGKAERWFDDTNEHPRDISFVDDDPPYYMKNQLSDYNSVCATQSENSSHNVSKIGPMAPTGSLLAQMDADNNNGEDYSSVIDDLTIQNKKLKKKLKKYEALHCSHLQEEKLFEIRIHGLAANRKRELEETLRSFASSIDEDSPHRLLHADSDPPIQPKTAPLLHKTSSSTTSASKPPHDSAYASMSGQTGAASQSHPAEHNTREKGLQNSRQNVSSYLLDIPKALAPKPSFAMSDRSKSKTIVRRLEQLFTGKAAAARQHGQSVQQQEVSQSAAIASGQRLGQEGTREAHILSADADLQVDSMEDVKARANNEGSDLQSLQASHGGSPRSPEQRPTRPLDLDPHRAQNPADNMEYIRHLGLTFNTENPVNGPASRDGWVYLNLLIGMAQLHTLNVTPEFIRKAVADFSFQLELSPDQTKVRWLGVSTGSRMSSDGDESEDQTYGKPSGSSVGLSGRDEAPERTSTRGRLVENSSTLPEVGAKRRPINLNEVRNEASDIQYRPLFFHTALSDEDGSDMASDSTDTYGSPNFTAATGINSATTELRNWVTRLRGPRKKEGPMIFYNRAKFCTDLSGDLDGARRRQCNYRRFTKQPVGASAPQAYESDESDVEDPNFCLDGQPVSQDVDMDSTCSPLNLDDLKSVISDYASSKGAPLDPMNMEASGLGGIQPEDNFVVKVQVRYGNKKRAHRKLPSKSNRQIRKILHNVPKSSIDAFRKAVEIPRSNGMEESVNGEIISSVKTDLAPSALPPPSYVCLPFSSSGSDDEESEADEDSEMSLQDYVNRGFLRDRLKAVRTSLTAMRGETSRYSSPTTAREDSDTGSDDSSIDLLAHARGLDPETIAAREREFESNNGDLAEVPAGSSAATVGGGSGRANPRYVDGEGSDINSMSVDGDESDDSE